MKKYIIGDVHGCLETLKALLEAVSFSKGDELYFLGDYVDRGPDVKGVFDFIFQLKSDGYTVVCLRGNHEQMMLDAREDDEALMHWLRNGGRETLRSFDVHLLREVPQIYWDFMESLPYYHEIDKYILVHGGLNFEDDNPLQNPMGLMWKRRWYFDMNYNWLGDRVIVHGHTPINKTEVEDMHRHFKQNRYLNLDSGCCWVMKKDNKMGYLTAFEMTTEQIYFMKCRDAVTF